METALEARSKTSTLPRLRGETPHFGVQARRHQDTKKIFEFSSLSRTFVTFAPEAHEPLAQRLSGTTFRLGL